MSKFITVRGLIEILNKVDPNLEVAIEHNNPNYTNTNWEERSLYIFVEPGDISVKDGCLVLDISSIPA